MVPHGLRLWTCKGRIPSQRESDIMTSVFGRLMLKATWLLSRHLLLLHVKLSKL